MAAYSQEDVVVVQAIVRGWLARHRLKKDHSVKQLRHRLHVVKEIEASQKAYLAHLGLLHDIYVQPLLATLRASKKPFLPRILVENLAVSLDSIHRCESEISTKLSYRISQWHRCQKLADCFFGLNAGIAAAYAPFIKCFDDYAEKLRNAQTTKPAFSTFLASRQAAADNKDLFMLLIMPVQRLPRVILLFEDLLKHTPEEHCDMADIRATLHWTKQFLDSVNRDMEPPAVRPTVRCPKCPCTEYVPHTWKPGVCSTCFHPHPPPASENPPAEQKEPKQTEPVQEETLAAVSGVLATLGVPAPMRQAIVITTSHSTQINAASQSLPTSTPGRLEEAITKLLAVVKPAIPSEATRLLQNEEEQRHQEEQRCCKEIVVEEVDNAEKEQEAPRPASEYGHKENTVDAIVVEKHTAMPSEHDEEGLESVATTHSPREYTVTSTAEVTPPLLAGYIVAASTSNTPVSSSADTPARPNSDHRTHRIAEERQQREELFSRPRSSLELKRTHSLPALQVLQPSPSAPEAYGQHTESHSQQVPDVLADDDPMGGKQHRSRQLQDTPPFILEPSERDGFLLAVGMADYSSDLLHPVPQQPDEKADALVARYSVYNMPASFLETSQPQSEKVVQSGPQESNIDMEVLAECYRQLIAAYRQLVARSIAHRRYKEKIYVALVRMRGDASYSSRIPVSPYIIRDKGIQQREQSVQ